MRIIRLPVYSKLADPDAVRATFGDRALPVQLSQHQLATYRALIDPGVDVAVIQGNLSDRQVVNNA